MKTIGIIITLISFSIQAASDFDETQIQVPFKNSNEERLSPTTCRTFEVRPWEICTSMISETQEVPKEFKFINSGENKIVPQTGFMAGREFTFMFQDLARSDLGLLVWDIPDEETKHGHLKLMMFFPREILPAIQLNSLENTLNITLPNRETVIFNADTKEILSGALKEGPISQDSDGNAISPLVNYTGKGVVLETHRINEYPAGFSGGIAIAKKIGYKDCKIPVRELWFTDNTKGGNVYFNKNFVTDRAFDLFLKSRCKFSIF